ncbi:MAG TPA: ABC transporter ATP-binding protein [Dehalococcoidia bacterium]|nr:ABC transporter ATP-binding protein [Dehalococcoidia bacterium]
MLNTPAPERHSSPSGNRDVVLRTIGLTRRYGRILAVDSLDLEITRGQIFGFLGPNGSGKTTTIGMALGLLRPTSGHVELFGVDTRRDPTGPLKRVGSVLEGPAVYPHLSGRDNLRIWAMIAGGVPPARIDEVLGLVGLSERAGSKARTYSLGMRQRLAIAAALLTDPDLVILDEPTNGLDPAGMREIRQLIRELGAMGKTVFVSSHLLGEVEQMCDQVAILKSGRLLMQGEVSSLVGQSTAVEMQVTDIDLALEILATLDFVKGVTRDGPSIVAETAHERAADLSRALAERGVYLSQLQTKQESLEEIFLEMTED